MNQPYLLCTYSQDLYKNWSVKSAEVTDWLTQLVSEKNVDKELDKRYSGDSGCIILERFQIENEAVELPPMSYYGGMYVCMYVGMYVCMYVQVCRSLRPQLPMEPSHRAVRPQRHGRGSDL